jgi:hypothetical protein
MAVKIRMNLIESRAGRKITQAQAWEIDKGLRRGAHKWHITPQPKTLQEMKDNLLVEIGRGFEVEMRNERPEFDEGGRNRIKKRKLGLKDTGVQLLEFRDTWVAVEDERVEMRQSDSEDRSDMEGEGEAHRKRQGSNSKGKQQDDNIHEREMQALRKLAEHKFKFRVQRTDKGGATVVISENRMNEESRSHVENDKAYELASNFSNVLGIKQEGLRKYQGAVVDGKQTEWSSTLDILPEGIDTPQGKWENEQDVVDSLWERMEWFLLKVMPREYEELPGTILTNLLVTHLILIDRNLTYKLINSISEFIDLNIKDIEF